MSQSGRNLIAQALARRALMGGAAMAGARDLRPLFEQTAPAWPITMKEYMERSRNRLEAVPPEKLMPTAPLERDDWVPADQPTSEEDPGYWYMKRRL